MCAMAESSAPAKSKKSDSTLALLIGACLLIIIPFVLVVARVAASRNDEARAHIAVNELGAPAAMRVITTAANTYRETYHHYPHDLSQLGAPASGAADEEAAELIDARLASGIRDGYQFSYVASEQGFELHADPLTANDGIRHFYSAQDGIIHVDNKTATGASPLLP
jgi:hypothetical protein